MKMHRIEKEPDWLRFCSLAMLILLFGFFSWGIIHLIAAESSAFRPLAQNARQLALQDPRPEDWLDQVPVALALVLVPGLAALTLGVHTLHHGGLYGVAASLFSLLPSLGDSAFDFLRGQGTLPVFGAFLAGILVAFYAGDVGSWICRRRLLREAKEDVALEVLRGDPGAEWLELDA